MTTLAPKFDVSRREWDHKLDRDLRTLALFIQMYCRDMHPDSQREGLELQMPDGTMVTDEALELCPECTKLMTHAFVKRSHCPMNPKPQCKHCPNQCYAPDYQARIREVMKHSGRKLVMRGRVDYLLYLLF